MQTVKKLLIYLLVGALSGAVAASLIAPGFIRWYNEPGPGAPPGFNLAPFAQHAMSTLLEAQAIGMGLGALVMLVLGIVIVRAGAQRRKASEATEAATRAQAASASLPQGPSQAQSGSTPAAPDAVRLPPM
jgi:hypothetical protein